MELLHSARFPDSTFLLPAIRSMTKVMFSLCLSTWRGKGKGYPPPRKFGPWGYPAPPAPPWKFGPGGYPAPPRPPPPSLRLASKWWVSLVRIVSECHTRGARFYPRWGHLIFAGIFLYALMSFFYRPHAEYDGKVMFLLCVSVPLVKVLGGPPPRSRSGGPPGQGLGAPQVKVQVKVWGAPRSRSGGPPGQGLGAPQVKVLGGPQVKVQVQVWGPPWSRSRGPPVQVQGGPGPGPRGAPWSRPRSRSMWAPQVQVQVKVWGPPLVSKSKNAESAGSTPLAVTQEDCLV